MTFKPIILTALKKKNRHGYELREIIKRITKRSCSTGTIYPLLSKLESMKYISSYQKGRRKYYKLLVKGRKSLEHEKIVLSEKIRQLKEIYNYVEYDDY